MSAKSLREKQRDNLSKMLKNIDSLWKILILDRVGQEIVSPIFRKSDLRELGVTVHLYVPLW